MAGPALNFIPGDDSKHFPTFSQEEPGNRAGIDAGAAKPSPSAPARGSHSSTVLLAGSATHFSHSLDKREGLSAQGVWGFIYTLENTGEYVPRASFSFYGG